MHVAPNVLSGVWAAYSNRHVKGETAKRPESHQGSGGHYTSSATQVVRILVVSMLLDLTSWPSSDFWAWAMQPPHTQFRMLSQCA